MKILKLDLMTVLFVVVLIGVVATMSTQANDYTVSEAGVVKVSATTLGVIHTSKGTSQY